uniref:Vacuolar protein sorting 13 homolog A n=1 Tax=Denticeps clupeoides TaxID=299321 RepID=A0AAY4BPN8_9TELE
MVFESLVVDVLNRFLGDYVVNLDSSQLRLGIWGGDAVLKNLEIKENALVSACSSGARSLRELKIPWKNLYTQSVEATLDEVYLLIVPTASIKYDAVKEDRQLQEARQRELQRIEETKQRAAEQDNPKQEKQDTFVEKLVTQVIKNLQVKISNIHVRYEDNVTNRNCPISFGVSLQNLSLQTADKNWTPCLLDDKAKLFYKLVRLDNLFAYWNVNSELYSRQAADEALRCLRHNIAVETTIPHDYHYVFRPISAKAKLQMNPRSDVDFSSPRVDLMVNLPEISIELSRAQYVSILELLGSVDMMSRNLPYRKYRPELPLHSNAFLWWRYAITGVLEVNVKPRLRMWSWRRIREHRQHVKLYRELYKKKITNKKPSESVLKELEETERTLDIFNITLARQQAEMEVSKAGLKVFRPGQKEEEQSQGWFGWIGGWWGENAPQSKEVKPGGFDGLMTSAEKAKLYTAIGYSETAVNHNLPKTFEDMKVSFQLVSMCLCIKESYDKPEIIRLAVSDLRARLAQRSGAQALSLFEVTGQPRDKVAPVLLSSRSLAAENRDPLLSLMFQTNPLEGNADQRLQVEAQPLEIIYDAMTVNSMSAFFQPPDDLQLDELTNATLMKLEQFRDRTATGLMYVIETQKVLDLKVNLMASYVIVPQTGFYDRRQNLMVLDLGQLKVSKTRQGLPQLSVGINTLEDIMSRAYDSFDIQLTSLQFLYSKPGDWTAARKLRSSDLHILEPVDLKMELSRAMVVTDSRMPKFKMSGMLPLLSLRISDDKLRGVLELIDSIPLPEARRAPKTAPAQSTPRVNSLASAVSISSEEEMFYDAPSSPVEDLPFFEAPGVSLSRVPSLKRSSALTRDPQKNMTDFLMTFEISEVSVSACYCHCEVPVLHLNIEGLGAELKLRTFDLSVNTFLKEICLACPEYMDGDDRPVHLITTLDNTEEDLLMLEYIKVLKPYKNTEQLVKVNFSSLDVHLHTEALLNAMNFLTNLMPPSHQNPVTDTPADLPTSKYEDVLNLHIRADLSCLKLFIRGQESQIAEIGIEGLVSEVQMKKKSVEVLAKLKDIIILDCDKEALYKKAVSIADKEVFDFHMVNHTDATEGEAYMDMKRVDTSVALTVGCIQVIFLNKFLSSILTWIDNFQTAKQTLAEVTAQAAEKAAVGVKELAERSTRISLDVHINAPVLFLPQSSTSTNVIVADLGLVTVHNQFAVVQSATHTSIPPVTDNMTVGLSDLKMYRTTFDGDKFQNDMQLLKPVNMDLSVKRNLSASWYHSVPDIEIIGHLKPMNVRTRGWWPKYSTYSPSIFHHTVTPALLNVSLSLCVCVCVYVGNTVVTAAVVETQRVSKMKNTLKLDFKFDSLTLALYSPTESRLLHSRDEQQTLAEFMLGSICTSVLMFSDGSMKATLKLSECLLDDRRQRVKNITSRMMAMRAGAQRRAMLEVGYRAGRDGTVMDAVLQDLYLCASMEFLLTVANVFLKASAQGFSSTQKTAPPQPVVAKSNMNVLVKNPEIVFVADLTRADAPALVVTTQCEVVLASDCAGQTMTAAVTDLKVVACPFLSESRRNTSTTTTVLQPCQVFFSSSQPTGQPQSMELSINSLTLKVSPIIINTVITIQSALMPSAETPEELESPVPHNLWERRDLRELKLWFLEEEGEEDALSVTPLVPQGESLQVAVGSICVTLEAGVGHRTVPMLLAKASFQGDTKNWSSLINLQSQLSLEVNYFNEVLGVWEPLLEPLEDKSGDGFRPWTLGLKMKKKPVEHSGISDEVDYTVPEYKTVISITSKDQLNVMLSKCGLNMLSNLGTAFAEAAKQTSECFQRDQAPFVLKNRLGVAVAILHSETLHPLGCESHGRCVELQDGESLNMDYTRSTADSDQFAAMTSLSGRNYYIQPTPVGHSAASVIPVIKVGKVMCSVVHNPSQVRRNFLCQIYSVDGSKYIKIRSPFLIINHFSIPVRVFEGDACLGTSLPNEEFCVPLGSYRATLTLQPVTEGAEQYERSAGFSYDSVTQCPGECVTQTCQHSDGSERVFKVNVVPLRDTVTTRDLDEACDEPYVLHLWPSVCFRNLLPYPVTYCLQVHTLLEAGKSTHLHTAVIDRHVLVLRLLDYLQQDWQVSYSLRSNQEEIAFLTFQSLRLEDGESERAELDVAVHAKYEAGRAVVALHSPYWMVNKTSRLLQYKADDVHRKHPKDYHMPLLFSFKPRNFFQNNKVRLMVVRQPSSSDEFSIDTVGSYGDVRCKGRQKDYLVGVKIDTSSFSLTRVVTFLPFYTLVNRTKHTVSVCEEGLDQWTHAPPEQVRGHTQRSQWMWMEVPVV